MDTRYVESRSVEARNGEEVRRGGEEARSHGSVERGKIRTFKDLHAWQEGHLLVLEVYRLTKKFPKDELFALVSQMRRAVVSVTSNIAEGFGRSSMKEKIQFYNIARGSVTEIQNQLLVSKDVGYISDKEFSVAEVQSERVHNVLNGLIRSSHSRIHRV